MNNIINRLKKETNNLDNIIYRKKRILFKDIHIIYIDALISSDKVSDFVMRSLNKIHCYQLYKIQHRYRIPWILRRA